RSTGIRTTGLTSTRIAHTGLHTGVHTTSLRSGFICRGLHGRLCHFNPCFVCGRSCYCCYLDYCGCSIYWWPGCTCYYYLTPPGLVPVPAGSPAVGVTSLAPVAGPVGGPIAGPVGGPVTGTTTGPVTGPAPGDLPPLPTGM